MTTPLDLKQIEEAVAWSKDFRSNFKDGIGKVASLNHANEMLMRFENLASLVLNAPVPCNVQDSAITADEDACYKIIIGNQLLLGTERDGEIYNQALQDCRLAFAKKCLGLREKAIPDLRDNLLEMFSFMNQWEGKRREDYINAWHKKYGKGNCAEVVDKTILDAIRASLMGGGK